MSSASFAICASFARYCRRRSWRACFIKPTRVVPCSSEPRVVAKLGLFCAGTVATIDCKALAARWRRSRLRLICFLLGPKVEAHSACCCSPSPAASLRRWKARRAKEAIAAAVWRSSCHSPAHADRLASRNCRPNEAREHRPFPPKLFSRTYARQRPPRRLSPMKEPVLVTLGLRFDTCLQLVTIAYDDHTGCAKVCDALP